MLIDTNVYSALANDSQVVVEIISKVSELVVPLPVIAELRYGFIKGSRAEQNERNLVRFLAQPQVSILLPDLQTTEHYAQLQAFCQQKGRALSHNDLWIAALALQHKKQLITCDKDFSVLEKSFGPKLIIV